jgi:hypothetical protein
MSTLPIIAINSITSWTVSHPPIIRPFNSAKLGTADLTRTFDAFASFLLFDRQTASPELFAIATVTRSNNFNDVT